MNKIDLFEVVVRYLGVKPLHFDSYDFEEAQGIIKKEKQGMVSFIGEHGYFEKTLDVMIRKVAGQSTKTGSLYVYVKGQGCSEMIKRKILELSMSVENIFIFGDQSRWPVMGPNVKFSSKTDIFDDNHQRFFVYHSNGLNIALVARHELYNGEERTEAIVTNDPEAVGFLGVTIGTHVYPLT